MSEKVNGCQGASTVGTGPLGLGASIPVLAGADVAAGRALSGSNMEGVACVNVDGLRWIRCGSAVG